jgi:hypothetical protein
MPWDAKAYCGLVGLNLVISSILDLLGGDVSLAKELRTNAPCGDSYSRCLEVAGILICLCKLRITRISVVL